MRYLRGEVFIPKTSKPTVLQTDDGEAVTWVNAAPATYVRTHLA
ncbi:MAG: hypothetical protein ACLPKI_04640 [Streptosporangiaceae bacterium]